MELLRWQSRKKEKTDTKNEAMEIKSYNFTEGNREKSNIGRMTIGCIQIVLLSHLEIVNDVPKKILRRNLIQTR